MRVFSTLFLLASGLFSGMNASAQSVGTCTSQLCQQQVSCPAGGVTTISGTIFAPNGVDPLPNVVVYIPSAPVDAFTPGVSCPVVGAPPSGSPLVGATTGVDGKFTIANVPVGTDIPLVFVSGRWRRQVVIARTTACTDTPIDPSLTRFPRNQSEGDIPKIAVATGSADQVECVLRKVGIDDAEFTDGTGSGRINLYGGSASHGAVVSTSSPTELDLMGNASTLNSYDVLMLPCEGTPGPAFKTASEYANLVTFANSGGRVYASHYSYQWMDQASTFSTVANWIGSTDATADGLTATVDTTFSDGTTLAQWLALVGAATTTNPTTISLSQIKHDVKGVNSPTQSYLTLNTPLAGDSKPVMQFVWNTPVNAATNQCGRVLFNEYHVETGAPTKGFPGECAVTATMTPQEKLLEYSLFELTNNGAAATLTPTTQDFGSVSIGFTSAPQTFTWVNNSTFSAGVTSLTASGDFSVTGNTCAAVAAGKSCTITVVFTPTALGPRTGVLTVGSSGSTLLATLTGTGTPDLSFSTTAIGFGSVDVGATTAAQTLVVTNTASGTVNLPGFSITGDFKIASSTCGSALAAGASCGLGVTFTPTTTGARTGTLTVSSNSPAFNTALGALTGNGVDFSVAETPTSGSVIAGNATTANILTTAIAGFSAPVTATCTTTAPGASCTLGATTFIPAPATTTAVKFATTSEYVIIGYGGVGAGRYLWLAAAMTGGLLLLSRRRSRGLLRGSLLALLLALASFSATGCSGKLPAKNAVFTSPGTYAFTVTETDGFLVHSATYTLTVTAK